MRNFTKFLNICVMTTLLSSFTTTGFSATLILKRGLKLVDKNNVAINPVARVYKSDENRVSPVKDGQTRLWISEIVNSREVENMYDFQNSEEITIKSEDEKRVLFHKNADANEFSLNYNEHVKVKGIPARSSNGLQNNSDGYFSSGFWSGAIIIGAGALIIYLLCIL